MFSWDRGIRITDTSIWCDAPRATELTFLSSAAVRGRFAGASKLVATDPTLRLRALSSAIRSSSALVAPLGRPFSLGRARLELLSAGSIVGAAQLHVETGQRSVVYGGMIDPRGSRLVEPARVRECEALCLLTPHADTVVRLPDRRRVEAALEGALRRSLGHGQTPVVLAPLFGVAQEVALFLEEVGLPVRVHERMLAVNRLCATFKGSRRQSARRFRRGTSLAGEVVLWPAEAQRGAALGSLRKADFFYVGPVGLAGGTTEDGRATAEVARRLGVERAFVMSSSGDTSALAEHAAACGARAVYLIPPPHPDVVGVFAARGIRVEPIGATSQMSLFTGRTDG